MKLHFFCKLVNPSNFPREVDTGLISNFTNTFPLVTCNAFEVDTKLWSDHTTWILFDSSTAYVGLVTLTYSCFDFFYYMSWCQWKTCTMYLICTCYVLSSVVYVYYDRRLQLFIYFKHINHKAVLFFPYESYILQWLIRVLAYFQAYNFAADWHYVRNSLILCSHIKSYIYHRFAPS